MVEDAGFDALNKEIAAGWRSVWRSALGGFKSVLQGLGCVLVAIVVLFVALGFLYVLVRFVRWAWTS